MNLSPKEFVEKYPLHHEFINGPRNIQKYCILPNLRKIKGSIYFIPKHAIKIFIDNKKKFIDKVELKNISLNGTIYCDGIKIFSSILNDELDNGLKIKMEFQEVNLLDNRDIKRFAREVESAILNIYISKNNEIRNSIKYKEELDKKREEELEKLYEYNYFYTEKYNDYLDTDLTDENSLSNNNEQINSYESEKYSDEDDYI